MSWALTDERGRAVAEPFASAHAAIDDRRSCPYVRLEKIDDGRYELDAGFSAADHEHFVLVDLAA